MTTLTSDANPDATDRFQHRLERLPGRVNENHIGRRIGKHFRESVYRRVAAHNLNIARREEIFQPGASQRGSGDNENADHAATGLLAGDGVPSCTATRRIFE